MNSFIIAQGDCIVSVYVCFVVSKYFVMMRKTVHIGSWNVRSLLDNEGSFKTSLSQGSKKFDSADRKVELLVREFRRYMDRISIAGVNETKWFGNDIYSVDGFTVLHSGRTEPSCGLVSRAVA